jgi:hypothetical protein
MLAIEEAPPPFEVLITTLNRSKVRSFAIKIAYSTIECMECSDGWHAVTDTEEDFSKGGLKLTTPKAHPFCSNHTCYILSLKQSCTFNSSRIP